MVIELTELVGVTVRSASGESLGKVDFAVINGKQATLLGFQVARGSVVKKFSGLYFADVIDSYKDQLVVEDQKVLKTNLQELDQAYKNFGPVIGVNAVTESGMKVGRVADLYIDLTTGGIIRFYLRNLLKEQIIPLEYLVAITPQQIVFKDIIANPKFEKTAAQTA